MPPRRSIALTAAAVPLLAGCSYLPGYSGPTADPPAVTTGPTPVSPAPSASPGTAAPSFSPVPGDDGPVSEPTASPAPAARYTAEAFARAWARPDLPAADWLAGVRPYVTPGYGQLLPSVDPARIPVHRITGLPVPTSATTVVNTFDVPTDAGTLQITCQLLGQQWLVASVELRRTP